MRRHRGTPADRRWQYGLLAAAFLLAVGLALLAVLRGFDLQSDSASDSQGVTDPDDSGSSEPADSKPPKVKDQRHANFARGDDLPNGAELYDVGKNKSGMKLADGGVTHGKPKGSGGTGYVEVELKSDVAKIGARVSFSGDNAGTFAITAWQDSVGATVEDKKDLPATGMRLIATAGAWAVEVIEADGGQRELIAQDTYESGTDTTFELFREEDRLWVVAPDGKVTEVSDPRVAELAGPWASWEISETEKRQAPVVLHEIWAG